MHWIAIQHKTRGDKYIYQIMDSLALPLFSYKDILNTISSMQRKNVSIETVLKNCMRSTSTFTCRWWSIYYLISSKFKTFTVPYHHSLNNYFKTLFEGEWAKSIFNNQHQDASLSKQNGNDVVNIQNHNNIIIFIN